MKVGEVFSYHGDLGSPGLYDENFNQIPVDFSGKAGLLLFIDYDLGSGWKNRLDSIWTEISSFLVSEGIATEPGDVKNHFHIAAVITNHSGTSSISSTPDYDVLLDGSGLGDVYRNEFCNSEDDCFPLESLDNVGTSLWGFIVDRDGRLADKWHDSGNTQTAGADTPLDPGDDVFSREPLSFHHLSTTLFPDFDSSDFDNVAAFVLERLKNLFRAPIILSAEPAIGSAGISVSDLSAVRIRFSRPMLSSGAVAHASYSFGGGGGSGLQLDDLSYSNSGLASDDQANVGEIENEATLTISKSGGQPLDAGTVRIELDTTAILTHDNNTITPNTNGTYALTYNGPEMVLSGISPLTGTSLNTHTPGIDDSLIFDITFTDQVFSRPASSVDLPVTTSLTSSDIGVSASQDIVGFIAPTDPPVQGDLKYSVTLDSSGWGGTGNISFSVGADGNRGITDRFGNVLRGSTEFEYTLDLDPPVTAIMYPADGSIVNNVTVRIETSGCNQKRLMINGQATVLNGDSINLTDVAGYNTLADGASFTLVLETEDENGNIATDSVTLTKNTNTPENMQPYHIVYVLDKSGSMNSSAAFGTPSVSKSKSVWVREALDAIVPDLLSEFGTASDRYGLVLYSGEAITSLTLTLKQEFSAVSNLFGNALDATPQGSKTAMGAGLARALDLLSYTVADTDYYGRRAVVFFADGQQNVIPKMIFDDADPHESLSVSTEGTNSGCPTGMGTINIPGISSIPIHTMGIGLYTSWLNTLGNLSRVSGGAAYANTEIWPDISSSLINILPQLFPTSSPQIVRNETETLNAAGTGNITFPLNSSISKIAVFLEWPGGSAMEMVLRKGGTKINFDRIIKSGRNLIGIVEFPHYQPKAMELQSPTYLEKKSSSETSGSRYSEPKFRINGRYVKPSSIHAVFKMTVVPKGDWSISISSPTDGRGAAGRSFLLSVIADEKDYFYNIRWEDLPMVAGYPVDVSVLLSRKTGLPPIDPEILVNVNSPSESFSNMLSQYHGGGLPSVSGDAPGGVEGELVARIDEMLSNPKLHSSLIKKKNYKVKLAPLKMNLTAGSLKEFEKQGKHNLRLILRHEDKIGGVYERLIDRSLLLSINPDFEHSEIQIEESGKYTKINITPKDRFGNMLGPGYKNRLSRKLYGYRIKDINDNLNGSYTVIAKKIGKSNSKADKNDMRNLLYFGKEHPESNK